MQLDFYIYFSAKNSYFLLVSNNNELNLASGFKEVESGDTMQHIVVNLNCSYTHKILRSFWMLN